MRKILLRKGLAIGIIIWFIISSSTPVIIGNQIKIQKSIHNKEEKGKWKTNYFCRIRVWVYGWCEPEFGIGFIRNAKLWGYAGYCRISGLNGTNVIEGDYKELELQVQYLFGYTYFWFQSLASEAYIRGFALICRYRV